MSGRKSAPQPPFLKVASRSLCVCKTCGSQFKSLMAATECCLGSNKHRTILSGGEPCSATNDTSVVASRTETVQHQLSLTGSGDFCRRGCCDFSLKFTKTSCNREQVS